MNYPNPSHEYNTRLAARRQRLERYRRIERIVARTRLAVGISFFFLLWIDFRWLLLLPVSAFVILIAYHDKILARSRRTLRAIAFYESGLARIEDRWIGTGDSQTPIATDLHPYAADLDIFGKGSLFELLNMARTRSGEETMARWLLEPADRNEILRRQAAIDELRNNIDLREDLAVLAAEVRAAVHPEVILEWAALPPSLTSSRPQAVAVILSAFTIFTCAQYELFGGNGWLALIAIAVQSGFGLIYRKRVRGIAAAVEQPGKDLEVLSLVLARLEREQFASSKLQKLREDLGAHGKPASSEIRRLARYGDMLNYRLNAVFALISAPFFWATHLSFALERWRQRNGPSIGLWLNAVGELEALCALAGYAYEHPGDPFPEILETGPLLEAEEMCHPLIPASRCVPNSISLHTGLQMLVVSGSNMSGKSTLLRTTGVNAVMAMAGAPVRAKRLRLSVLRIGATIRVLDSLQAGTSRFYAEIQRLHDIMELAKGPSPVFFLLDEILHGTNSHDRAIGAEAVLRGLIARGAIGLVTTHDLALAKVADSLAPRAANAHFEDHLEEGKMRFDYRLRRGVVEKSNALELMRAVGLEV
jgi:MutS domain V/MutS domain III